MKISGAKKHIKKSLLKNLPRLAEIVYRRDFPANVKEAGCLFIHIPKTGGMSVSMATYGTQLFHYDVKFWKQYLPYSFDKISRFATIRDPIDRFQSAYYFLKNGGLADIDKAFNERYIKNSCINSFIDKNFSQPINEIMRFTHFRSQNDFIKDESGKICVNILLKFERLQEDYERLISQNFKVKGSLPTINKNHQKGSSSISPENIKLLQKIYYDDLNLHGNITRFQH